MIIQQKKNALIYSSRLKYSAAVYCTYTKQNANLDKLLEQNRIIIDAKKIHIQKLLDESGVNFVFELDITRLLSLIKKQKSPLEGLHLYVKECERQLNAITNNVSLKLKICQSLLELVKR
jgi:hypothetical protein